MLLRYVCFSYGSSFLHVPIDAVTVTGLCVVRNVQSPSEEQPVNDVNPRVPPLTIVRRSSREGARLDSIYRFAAQAASKMEMRPMWS
jgi:hypothetical protein